MLTRYTNESRLSSRGHNSQSKLMLRNNQTVRNGTSTCLCKNNTIFQIFLFSRFLPPTYAGHFGQAVAGICDERQSGKTTTLFQSLFFVFRISFMANYRDKYYDYIVKWCSAVARNCCVSLDIALMLPLTCTL